MSDKINQCTRCNHDKSSHDAGECAGEVDGIRLGKWCNCKEFLESIQCTDCGHQDYDHGEQYCNMLDCECDTFNIVQPIAYRDMTAEELVRHVTSRDAEIKSLENTVDALNDTIEQLNIDIARTNLDNNPNPLCQKCDHIKESHMLHVLCSEKDCTCTIFESYDTCTVCEHSEHDHHHFRCIVPRCTCEEYNNEV